MMGVMLTDALIRKMVLLSCVSSLGLPHQVSRKLFSEFWRLALQIKVSAGPYSL